jgi:CDP-glucose 4,6-dehydratase
MKNLFNGIYKGKKILVTGHTGFKGSWLTLWLTKLGADVIGYSDSIPTKPSHHQLLKLPITSVKGDIKDREKVFKTIKKYKPDVIFHMAAQPLVRKSYVVPAETFETNMLGTLNILEAARLVDYPKVIVNITSDKVYKNFETGQNYTEEDIIGGTDPYSSSKAVAEIVSHSYRVSYFPIAKYGKTHTTLLANVRAGNVIGGGDWAEDRLIPDIMRATSKKEKVVIRKPNAVRPWQHVLEPLSGYLLLGAELLKKEAAFADNWNFGPRPDGTLTVREVIKHTKKHWSEIEFDIQENPNDPHEAHLLTLDSSKARKLLKWVSVWNGSKTFEKTVHWYKQYYQSAKIMSEKDLNDYIADARKQKLIWTQ